MPPEQTPRTTNKKHLARIERERRQRRYILIGTAVVAVLIIGVLAAGPINQNLIQPNQAVAKVDDQTITVRQFQSQVTYQRQGLVQNYEYLAGTFGSLFASDLQNIQQQLADPTTYGQQVLEQMIDDIVIKKEAAKLGVTVSDAEVEKAVQEAFGYYANGTPTPQPTSTPFVTSTLSPTQMAIVTITPTPTSAPTATPTLAPTPGGITGTPTAIPSATPSPTPYTLDSFQKNYTNYVDQIKTTGFTEQQYRSLVEAGLYQQKVYDAVTKSVPATQDQVWARHILVQTEDDAKKVVQRLQSGEDWSKVAADVSQDTATKDSGGDLGWFPRGVMDPAFEKVAFTLKIGQISDPVQTSYGWHIIQVLGHETRPLTDSQLQQAKQTYYNDWLTQARSQHTIERYNWQSFVPSEPTIPPEYLSAAAGQ
jgi:parvulin-like peptidyl-prolyl isomerase